jgi:hypothetical protein
MGAPAPSVEAERVEQVSMSLSPFVDAPLPPPHIAPEIDRIEPVPTQIETAIQTDSSLANASSPVQPSADKPSVVEDAPLPPSLPVDPNPEPRETPASKRPFDWESIIGVRLFSMIAGVALLVAAIGFLRYSLDRGWLGPPVRMAIGLIVGVGLIVVCETRRAQRYQITAYALTAAGIATLFATLFASHALWGLIESAVLTFVLLALVAAVAVLLSVRRNSLFIALLGLVGGFVTPILLSTGEDRPIALFGYLLLLNIGLYGVAYLKRWPVLVLLSFIFTAVYQIGWTASFFDENRMPLAIGIFVIFPLVGFGALVLTRLRKSKEPESPLFAITARISAVVPVLFGAYLSFTPASGAHFGILFGFLFLLAIGFVFVAAYVGPEWIHPLMGGAVLFVTASFLGRSYVPDARIGLFVFCAAFIALYLGAPYLMKRLGRPFVTEAGRWGTYTSPLMLFIFPVTAAIDPASGGALVFFGTLFIFAAALSTLAVLFENGPVHLIAAAFVTVSIATWSHQYLEPCRLMTALLVYGGCGLFYLGVPLIARRFGKVLRPEGGASAMLLVSISLLFFLVTGPIAQIGLTVIAVLLGIFNIGLLVEASQGRTVFFAAAGILLSWIVMAVWWFNAPIGPLLIPALAVMEGFALLVIGGSIAAHRYALIHGSNESAQKLSLAPFLGLIGHFFLVGVVCNPELAASFGPWLAVLGVLDLAVFAAALLLRNGALFLSAVSLTGLLLFFWMPAVTLFTLPPLLARVAAPLLFGALSVLFAHLAERRNAPPLLFNIAVFVGLFLADLVIMQATALVGRTGEEAPQVIFTAALISHLVLLLGVLFHCRHIGQHAWSFGAVFLFGIAVLVWNFADPGNWSRLLGLATPIYLLFLINPLVLNDRVRTCRFPFVTVLIASVMYFFFARHAISDAKLMGFIGLLPVIQAFLLIPHIKMLLRMEPPSERDMGRLALMAGGVLAFVTAAIPLQLDKQWITIGWALLGAALSWLYRRIPHKGILIWLTALLGIVFVRLTLNPAVFSYYPRAETPIINWYLYTWMTTATCFFAAAKLLGPTDDRFFSSFLRLSWIFRAFGTILLFYILNIEITDYFSNGDHLTFSFSEGLAQNLSYTIGWALFAGGLLIAGVFFESKVARIVAIVLLAITVLKAFLFDLSHLTGLYRVASFTGLAVCLVLVAVILQRFVIRSVEKDKES